MLDKVIKWSSPEAKINIAIEKTENTTENLSR